MYKKLEEASVEALCKLLIRHPQFNFRINILTVIMPKLASKNLHVRK
jgi:hypothetical protein